MTEESQQELLDLTLLSMQRLHLNLFLIKLLHLKIPEGS